LTLYKETSDIIKALEMIRAGKLETPTEGPSTTKKVELESESPSQASIVITSQDSEKPTPSQEEDIMVEKGQK